MSAWIKRSEREPVEADYPIMAGHSTDMGWAETCYQGTMWKGCAATHWRSIKCDPPPRELTQRERDDGLAQAVLENWIGAEGGSKTLALLAVYAERREVAKLMSDWFSDPNWGRGVGICPKAKAIRARLDEQGVK